MTLLLLGYKINVFQIFIKPQYKKKCFSDAVCQTSLIKKSMYIWVEPTKAPTQRFCPYIVLKQPDGETPFDGLYEKMDEMRNGRNYFVHPTYGTLFHNGEVWIIVGTDASVSFVSKENSDSIYPPTSDDWDHVVGTDSTPYSGVQTICDGKLQSHFLVS